MSGTISLVHLSFFVKINTDLRHISVKSTYYADNCANDCDIESFFGRRVGFSWGKINKSQCQ